MWSISTSHTAGHTGDAQYWRTKEASSRPQRGSPPHCTRSGFLQLSDHRAYVKEQGEQERRQCGQRPGPALPPRCEPQLSPRFLPGPGEAGRRRPSGEEQPNEERRYWKGQRGPRPAAPSSGVKAHAPLHPVAPVPAADPYSHGPQRSHPLWTHPCWPWQCRVG